MNYLQDIIYYFFRGRRSIVSIAFLAILGIIYMFQPYTTVKCINGLCRVTTGKKVVSTFSADNIESCTISSRRCGSSKRQRRRYCYYPEISMKDGQRVRIPGVIKSHSQSAMQNFCNGLKTNNNFTYQKK